MAAANTILPTEDSEQAALFDWANYASGRHPELALLYAVPNGGKRHIKTAITLRRTGVKPGVPDIHLPVARGGYHSLYIEMKRRKGGTVSPEQKEWHKALTEQGHRCQVCKGWDEARQVLEEYLASGTTKTA